MTQRAGIARLGNLTGGEATVFPASAMPSKFSCLMQNCHVSESGSIAKIPGYVRVNAASCGVQLTSGFRYRMMDGTVVTLVAGGGTIYRLVGDALSPIKTGLNTSALLSFAAIGNTCIIVNGVDPHMKYDGNNVTELGANVPAHCFFAHVHKGRVWMLGRDGIAYHSALNAPTDFSTPVNAGYIDFKFVLKRGVELLDCKTYIDLQVFFFRDAVVIYAGSNPTSEGDYRIVQQIDETGIARSNGSCPFGTDLVFVAPSGIKTLRQVVATGGLGFVGNLDQAIAAELYQDIKRAGSLSVCHYPARGWLVFQIGNVIRIYNYVYKAWGRLVGGAINHVFSDDAGEMFFCGNGYLYRYGTGWTFDGALPEMIWETAWLTLSRQGFKTYPKILEITAFPERPLSLQMETMFDMAPPMAGQTTQIEIGPLNMTDIDAVTDWDGLYPIDEVLFTSLRVPLFGGGRMMRLRFRNVSALPVSIADLAIQYQQGGF
jgi:hypothetical protein